MKGTSQAWMGTALLLLMAACAGGDNARSPTVMVADGPPTACISTRQIRSMRIVDDQTIEFEMSNRRVYRNTLPFRCSGLGFNQAIRHNSRTAQLCSVNMIMMRAPGGGWSGPSCQLGMFQPMKRVPVPEAPASQ